MTEQTVSPKEEFCEVQVWVPCSKCLGIFPIGKWRWRAAKEDERRMGVKCEFACSSPECDTPTPDCETTPH